jgi:hypothetical protein
MKQINDLVVITIPRNTSYTMQGLNITYVDKSGFGGESLPFQCEIIGLASEVKIKQIEKILKAAHIIYNDLVIIGGYAEFIHIHSFTDETKDYLFLRRKM